MLEQNDDDKKFDIQDDPNDPNNDLTDDDLDLIDENIKPKILKQREKAFAYKHWREKHGKTQKELDDYKVAHPEEKKDDKKDDKKETDNDRERRLTGLELRQLNSSLDDEDIDKAIKWANADGTKPSEVISSSWFKSVLKEKADRKAADDANPSGGNRTGENQNSLFERAIKDPKLVRGFDEKTLSSFKAYCKEKGAE